MPTIIHIVQAKINDIVSRKTFLQPLCDGHSELWIKCAVVIAVVYVDVMTIQTQVKIRTFVKLLFDLFDHGRTRKSTELLISYNYQISFLASGHTGDFKILEQICVNFESHSLESVEHYKVFDLFFSSELVGAVYKKVPLQSIKNSGPLVKSARIFYYDLFFCLR